LTVRDWDVVPVRTTANLPVSVPLSRMSASTANTCTEGLSSSKSVAVAVAWLATTRYAALFAKVRTMVREPWKSALVRGRTTTSTQLELAGMVALVGRVQ